jgi:hypothetical protein
VRDSGVSNNFLASDAIPGRGDLLSFSDWSSFRVVWLVSYRGSAHVPREAYPKDWITVPIPCRCAETKTNKLINWVGYERMRGYEDLRSSLLGRGRA